MMQFVLTPLYQANLCGTANSIFVFSNFASCHLVLSELKPFL